MGVGLLEVGRTEFIEPGPWTTTSTAQLQGVPLNPSPARLVNTVIVCAVLVSCAVAAVAIADSVNRSQIATVGETVNVSCASSSTHPVDIYYQHTDDAGPILLYANNITLEHRYDVAVSLADECRPVDGRGRHLTDGPGMDDVAPLSSVLKHRWSIRRTNRLNRAATMV